MVVSQDETERRVSLFSRALRESGLSLTHQRLEVAREIASTDAHPDTETVWREVRKRVPTISLDTVYRTLAALERIGLIARVDPTAEPARYDADLRLHHHFYCTRCGSISDVHLPTLEASALRELAVGLEGVQSVQLQLRGLCMTCQ